MIKRNVTCTKKEKKTRIESDRLAACTPSRLISIPHGSLTQLKKLSALKPAQLSKKSNAFPSR